MVLAINLPRDQICIRSIVLWTIILRRIVVLPFNTNIIFCHFQCLLILNSVKKSVKYYFTQISSPPPLFGVNFEITTTKPHFMPISYSPSLRSHNIGPLLTLVFSAPHLPPNPRICSPQLSLGLASAFEDRKIIYEPTFTLALK